MAIFTVDVVDENNSTTATLGSGATYTGTSTSTIGYASITVAIYADVDSAADGVQFQFSSDNSNWDFVNSFTLDVSESDNRVFPLPVKAEYFRVVYTNGAGAQSEFRLQTILHENTQLTSLRKVSEDVVDDAECHLNKSAIMGYVTSSTVTSGDLGVIAMDTDRNLKVSIEADSAGISPAENDEVTLLASAARTATVNSADQDNTSWRGLHVVINVTAEVSTPSITPFIQGKDSISGTYYDLLEGDSITDTGITILKLYPGITAKRKVSASDILPKTWRVRIEHADSDSITYSVSANLVL